MSLDPKAIAQQGLGFGPRLIAVQGLWRVEPRVPVEPPFVHRSSQRKKRRRDSDDDVLLFILR